MEKNLSKNINNQSLSSENNFGSIKITLASPDKIKSCLLEKLKNQRLLITELLDPKRTVYFVHEYLDQLKIMNVYVENIRE